MRKNTLVTIAVIMICSMRSFAQQEPMSAQYIMNKLFVNPAYAGYKEAPQFALMHRTQWLGFEGAPMTQVLSFDMPLKRNEFAFGSTIMHDRIGPSTRMSVTLDFAYRFKLSNRGTLSFGLKGVADMYQNNINGLELASDYYNQVDDAFLMNTTGLFLPNAGFGMYYFDRTSFFGVSIPRLLPNRLDKKGTIAFDLLNGRQEATIHVMAGKIWKINRQVKLQPNVVLRSAMNSPMSIALYGNVIFLDQFTLGTFYSVSEAAGLLFQWQVDKRIRIGYSVDVPANRLIRTNFGSHELSVVYQMKTKRKRIVYPRYF